MEIVWRIRSSDKKLVKDLLADYKDNIFVKRRIKKNIARARVNISRKRVWRVLVGCLLTTQQKSGPESRVAKFMRTKPFPLDYDTCLSKRDVVESFSYKTLSNFGGIRRTNTIAYEIAKNLSLEKDIWTGMLQKLKSLQYEATQEEERIVADYINENFLGFGPKQSRNLLQWLGLTRYEIPIDSRITKWLNEELKFPVALNASTLQDKNYYRFVSYGIQELCKACGVYPCIFDAAVFARADDNRRVKRNTAELKEHKRT